MTGRTSALARLGALAARRRWWLCGAVVVLLSPVTGTELSDLALFAGAGRDVVTGHIGRVYAHADIQSGPIQLVLSWLFSLGSDGNVPALPVRIVVDLLVVAAVAAVTRRLHCDGVAATVAAVMTVLWLGPSAFWSSHLTEALIPVLWVGAALSTRRGSWDIGGVQLGAAIGIAPWAVLAAPTLLTARPKDWRRSLAVGAVTTSALYGPFVASGHFAMFRFHWRVIASSPIHLLDPHAATMGWGMRVVQAAIVAGGCLAVVLALRGRRHAVVPAALMAAVLRVLTDPLGFDYYWIPVAVLSVLTVVLAREAGRSRVLLIALGICPGSV